MKKIKKKHINPLFYVRVELEKKYNFTSLSAQQQELMQIIIFIGEKIAREILENRVKAVCVPMGEVFAWDKRPFIRKTFEQMIWSTTSSDVFILLPNFGIPKYPLFSISEIYTKKNV